MGKSLADLKAGLDYAKSKLLYYDTNLAENSTEYDCEQREMWANKVREFERLIDESVNLLEG